MKRITGFVYFFVGLAFVGYGSLVAVKSIGQEAGEISFFMGLGMAGAGVLLLLGAALALRRTTPR